MGLVEQIQAWYAAQCDGGWEHQYGVSIETLDNPGWCVMVDLSGTSLENISFQTYQEDKGEAEEETHLSFKPFWKFLLV